MPHRVELISHLIEIVFLNICNAIILLSLMNIFAAIPIVFSVIYSVGRIKRDINHYHNGNTWEYIKFVLGRAKKN